MPVHPPDLPDSPYTFSANPYDLELFVIYQQPVKVLTFPSAT